MQRSGEESVSFNLCLTLPNSSWVRNVMSLFGYHSANASCSGRTVADAMQLKYLTA